MPYTKEQIADYARQLEEKGASREDIESFVGAAVKDLSPSESVAPPPKDTGVQVPQEQAKADVPMPSESEIAINALTAANPQLATIKYYADKPSRLLEPIVHLPSAKDISPDTAKRLVSIPGIPVPVPLGVVAGLYEGIRPTAEGAISPVGLATLPAAELASATRLGRLGLSAASAYFAKQAGQQAIEEAKQIPNVLKSDASLTQKTAALAAPAVSGLAALGAGAGTVAGLAGLRKAPPPAEPPLIDKVDSVGKDATLQQANAAANEVATRSVNTQEPPNVAPATSSEPPATPPVGRRVAIDDEAAIEAAAAEQQPKAVEPAQVEPAPAKKLTKKEALAQARETQKNQEVKFIGDQEDGKGGSFALYNLTQDIVDSKGNVKHGVGSTVSENTLKKYGIKIPERNKPAPPPEVPVVPEQEIVPPDPNRPIRNLAQRVIEDKAQPQQLREKLAQQPEIHYDQLAVGDLIKTAAKSTEDELVKMVGSEDKFVRSIGKIEKANRLDANGKYDEAAALYADAATEFTTSAQLLNAAKAVRSPRAYVDMTQKLLEKSGGKDKEGNSKLVLSPEQKAKVEALGREEIRLQRELDNAEDAARLDFTAENEKSYQDAKKALGKAKLDTAEYLRQLAPRTWSDILTTFIQGNLLTPISVAASFTGNALFAPIRRTVGTGASALDAVYSSGASKLSGREVPRVIKQANPLPSAAEATAFKEGIKVAAKEMVTGPSPDTAILGEIQRGFRPLRALIQAFSGEGYARTAGGKIPLSSRAKSLIEGTLGVFPEAMFRMLNVTDKPFRYSERMRSLMEQARIKGLEGRELEKFIEFPDKKALEIADRESRASVFAQEGKGFEKLNRLLDPGISEILRLDKVPAARSTIKVLSRMVVPFRQFPINYVMTALDFASPELAFSKALYYANSGDRRRALSSMATGATGAMLYAATDFMWKHKLISEPVSDDPKRRSIQQNTMGAARLNISGLERLTSGGDPAWKPGDTTIDWTKTGIPAAIMYIRTNQLALAESKDSDKGIVGDLNPQDKDILSTSMDAAINRIQAFPGMASFALDQSFLAGTSTWLEMMKSPDPESSAFQNGIQNLFRVVSAIPVPNTFEALARAKYEFIPEIKGDSLGETVANIWKYKTFQLPEGERAVVKHGFWGEPVRRTPYGANPYVYNMADVFKTGATEPSEFNKRLYDLYNQTKSTDVYPSLGGRTLTQGGVTVKLDPKDAETLEVMKGRRRKEIASQLVLSEGFTEMNPYEKIDMLKSAYSDANAQAQDEFLNTDGRMNKYFGELIGGRPSERVQRRDNMGAYRLDLMNPK